MERSPERLEILRKIEEYERRGWFDRDVENDPPARRIEPGEVDYTQKRLSTKLKTYVANEIARRYFDGCIRKGKLIIKEVRGIENYLAVKSGGVVITANHFNPYDNYAVYKVIEPYLERRLYKVIREGNYTNFPGLYGFFFRHCNTVPIPTGHKALAEMMDAVDILLRRGEKLLIYPEQGMWWNYRKPRPLKSGAFRFAVKAGVPVLPMFITMEDTEMMGKDGFPIQAYTVHILPALLPDDTLTAAKAAKKLCEENYAAWRELYEDFYGIPLEYTTEDLEAE